MKRSALWLLTLALGCGDDDVLFQQPYQDYEDGDVTVIGGADGEGSVATASGDNDCVQVSDDTCTPVERRGKYCKSDEGPVDVVVVDGEVREVVCYEDTDGGGPDDVTIAEGGGTTIPQQGNGAVITFAAETDGQAVEGDVVIDGNDVTLYGNGPDKSIIDGDLLITGNNARVRGVRVTGNVTMDLNTAAFVFSVVDGNLLIRSNNCLVAEVDVFGNLVNDGNNSILVRNDVDDNFEGSGSGAVCDRNSYFDDDDGDGAVSDAERGEGFDCN
ncbi:MAG: hypothetical protein RMA76_04640 [Deltaproteobacteria bacterium]|jgi:hypothetical protein